MYKGLGRFKHLKGLNAGGFFSLSLSLAPSPTAFLFDRTSQKQQSHHKNRQLRRLGYEYSTFKQLQIVVSSFRAG